jgi:hypothetical protein
MPLSKWKVSTPVAVEIYELATENIITLVIVVIPIIRFHKSLLMWSLRHFKTSCNNFRFLKEII